MLTCMTEPAETGRNQNEYLRERYGNSQKARRSWLIPAIVIFIVGGGWLLWSANHYSKPEVSTDLISFTTSNPKQVSLKYFVNVRTSTRSHQCILIASDYQTNIVGQVTDTIPSGGHSYTRTVVIPTRAPAVSATIEHCS